MSIRIVGLGAIVEKYPPKEAFKSLSILAAQIESIVNQNGGSMEKSFRNDFLCIFDGLGGNAHAVAALKCAWEIQTTNSRRNIENGAVKLPVYALQIGITSARVYIGSLGPGREGILGRPLDIASALTESCEAHSIVFSHPTRLLIPEEYLNVSDLKSTSIHVRNEPDLIVSYTLDPLKTEPDIRRAAISALRLCAELARVDPRTEIKDPNRIMITSNIGSLELRDVSRSGIGFLAKQAVGLGVLLHIKFETLDGKLQKNLEAKGVKSLTVEVRWSKVATSDGCYCGARYVGLEEHLGDYVSMLLLETQK